MDQATGAKTLLKRIGKVSARGYLSEGGKKLLRTRNKPALWVPSGSILVGGKRDEICGKLKEEARIPFGELGGDRGDIGSRGRCQPGFRSPRNNRTKKAFECRKKESGGGIWEKPLSWVCLQGV